MNSYKVQVRLPNGMATWLTIQARSLYEAEQIGKTYGQIIIVYNA